MAMTRFEDALREIIEERLSNFVFSSTSLDGHAAEFWRWMHEAIRTVLLAADIGNQASCYVNGGLRGLANAKQFLRYGDTYIFLNGVPK